MQRMTCFLVVVGWMISGVPAVAQVFPAKVLDLSRWNLTLPEDTDHKGNPDEISVTELQAFTHPQFFFVSDSGDAVVFRAPCNGAATKNSDYPRSELREMQADGRPAKWSTDDPILHELHARISITGTPSVKQHVVCAQIHGGDDDVIQIRLEKKKLFVERDGEKDAVLDGNYQLASLFELRITAGQGVLTVWYNGEQKLDTTIATHSACYFKAGCYTQSNSERGEPVDSAGEVMIHEIAIR